MNILFLMIPITLLLAGTFLFLFIWSNNSGQFDDLVSPSYRMLDDKSDTNEINIINNNRGIKNERRDV